MSVIIALACRTSSTAVTNGNITRSGPCAEARTLLHHLLEHGDVVGSDSAGRTVIQLPVDDWVLDRLLAFDAGAAELEDVGDDESSADDEEDGPPVVVEIVRPKVVGRREQVRACG